MYHRLKSILFVGLFFVPLLIVVWMFVIWPHWREHRLSRELLGVLKSTETVEFLGCRYYSVGTKLHYFKIDRDYGLRVEVWQDDPVGDSPFADYITASFGDEQHFAIDANSALEEALVAALERAVVPEDRTTRDDSATTENLQLLIAKIKNRQLEIH